jgi:FAD/FMN-containing dehydrogenase
MEPATITPFIGPVLRVGDVGYDDARSVFNAMIDRHPAMVVRCAEVADIVAAVRLARSEALELAVKSGGHSVAGTAVCDNGIVVDISGLKDIEIDVGRGIARVGAGVTLGELDAATAEYGLATPTGIVSVTGLSGLALGGGLGWLNGRHGLTCDNIVSAEVVTATGDVATASADSHPDLYWALRGGSGNFGIVTTFVLRLHPVDMVVAGALGFGAARAQDALVAYDHVARSSPDDLSINASIFLDADGCVGVGVGFCHLGQREDLDQLLRELRTLGPLHDEVADTRFVDLQRSSDGGFPEGRRHYWKSLSLGRINDAAAGTLIDQVVRMPSPTSAIGLQQMHGAAARVAPDATAYPHRSDRYDLLVLSQWDDPAADDANIAWTNACFDAIEPASDHGVYVNNLGVEGEERVRRAYGVNYERLGLVKARYDPTNLFRQNHNILPSSS